MQYQMKYPYNRGIENLLQRKDIPKEAIFEQSLKHRGRSSSGRDGSDFMKSDMTTSSYQMVMRVYDSFRDKDV